jgi:DNA polymerase-3 subunit alpha
VGTGHLPAVADGVRVLLCGLVGALREVNTKNGSRMGFVTLEDIEGTVEITVFPEMFRQSVVHLRSGGPLLVRGRVEGSTTARKLLAEDIRPLPAAEDPTAPADAPPAACRVRLASEVGAAAVAALHRLCEAHRGPVPVFVHVELQEHEVVIRSRAVRVSPSPALVAGVEALLGPRSITFAG